MSKEEAKFYRDMTRSMQKGDNYLKQFFGTDEFEEVTDEYTPADEWKKIQAAYDGFDKALLELTDTLKNAAVKFMNTDEHNEFIGLHTMILQAYNTEEFATLRFKMYKHQLEEERKND